MRKIAQAIITTASSAVLVLGLATAASANGDVTWRSETNSLCLAHTENGWGNPDDAGMRSCGSNGAAYNGWYEELQSDGTWLFRATSDRSYCLTAYKDHDVYMEKCSGNDWQRWYENKVDNGWRLGHKATQWYLEDDDNGMGVQIKEWDGGSDQLWH
ncbi:hypothetical protein ACFYMW_40665 [Streptomyces sp. NPDC006692]|uniref:hypothetical protein n=1 Tax=unclassified Streptomyces TaxID=2593676 RepID=UPI003420B567